MKITINLSALSLCLFLTFLLFTSNTYANGNLSTIDNITDNSSSSNELYYDNTSKIIFSDNDTYELEDMEITEKVLADETGKTTLPRLYIENAPRGNGGVTDLLRIVPSVQFNENYRSAENAGEIAPSAISISGGKSYENLFLIDGINNSSILDPASDSQYNYSDVKGNSQKFSIDSWLIEDITVYDSNVPTKYDGFTGGVVDVVTKRPSQKLSGALGYRTTSSNLTIYHLNDNVTEKPSFDKQFISASLNVPITDDFALLGSYKRNTSIIPSDYFYKFRTETREAETYMLKGGYNINGLNHINATVSYSPGFDKYYIPDTENSEFTTESGGFYSQISYARETGLGGSLNANINYSVSENSRQAPNELFYWLQSNEKFWGIYLGEDASSAEGGWGSIDKQETNFNFNISNLHDDIDFFGTHSINYGFNYDYITGREHRLEDAYQYSEATASIDVICPLGSTSCIPNEQFFSARDVTPEHDTLATINKATLYAEDTYSFYRFDLRAGVRVTYDDYMDNINIAPRSQLSYDIFDNLFTVLTFGYNRYYSSTLLAYKLREGRAIKYTEERFTTNNIVGDWLLTSSDISVRYNFRSLKTPYNDELLASIDQSVLGGTLNIKYIERFGKNAFASETFTQNGVTNIELNNNGDSRYTSVQLKWSKNWDNHYFMANTSWQQSFSSNDTYDESLDLEDLETDVVFNGEIIKLNDLPEENFNRPIVINAGYVGKFYDQLFISANIKFTTGYRENVRLDENLSVGSGTTDPVTGETVFESLAVYETVEYRPNITVDLAVEWHQPLFFEHKLILTAEINNLFNTRNEIGVSSSVSSYELGTQLWLGATYEF